MINRDWIIIGRAPTADEIISQVAAKHGLTVAELKSRSAAHRIARPRQEAMYELRKLGRSSTWIARKLGLKDHSTVLYGSDAYADRAGLPRISELEAMAEAA